MCERMRKKMKEMDKDQIKRKREKKEELQNKNIESEK